MNVATLCEYCSIIDFDMLRLPTVGDIRRLNKGAENLGVFPWKPDGSDGFPRWSLGLQSRIRKSAATCDHCSIVQEVTNRSGVLEELSLDNILDPLCFATIEHSGRLMPEDGAVWKDLAKSSTEMYFYLRRLCLNWRPLDRHDIIKPGRVWDSKLPIRKTLKEYLQVKSAPDLEESELFCNSQLPLQQKLYGGRTVATMLNKTLLKKWIHHCLESHREDCGQSGHRPSVDRLNHSELFTLRLIDVNKKSLTEVIIGDGEWPTYVALSYVWGGDQKLKLSTSNKSILAAPGSLDGTASKTVDDAIYMTGLLDIQYIWVDALCIIQDDDLDKSQQIHNMSAIYENALFTIIAATGMDAEAGIPGVRTPRVALQREMPLNSREQNDGASISLLTTLNPQRRSQDHVLDDTVWATRGWTLQERAVSRRALIFTDNEALWACKKACWREDTLMEPLVARTSLFCLHESDNVLDSSIRRFYVADEQTEQIWFKLKSLVLNYTQRNLSEEGDAYDAFNAVIQQVKRLLAEHFIWAIPASRFELGLCWEPHRHGLLRRTCLTTLEMTSLRRKVPFPSWSWLGWKGAISLRVEDRHIELGIEPEILCYVLRVNPPRLVRVSRVASDGKASHLPPTMLANLRKSPLAVDISDIVSNCPEWTEERLSDTPDDQLIFFWSESAHFNVSGIIKEEKPLYLKTINRYYYHQDILDSEGNRVGRTSACRLADRVASATQSEFILIASNRPPFHAPQKIVWQIERHQGIVYRVNIAEIDENAWSAAKPSRTLVAMG